MAAGGQGSNASDSLSGADGLGEGAKQGANAAKAGVGVLANPANPIAWAKFLKALAPFLKIVIFFLAYSFFAFLTLIVGGCFAFNGANPRAIAMSCGDAMQTISINGENLGQIGEQTRTGDRVAAANSDPGTLTDEQRKNAQIIAAVGDSLGISDRGKAIAIATALQESSLLNINHGDQDSIGLFQQRPSQGWGSVEQIMNPQYAATKFYQGLQQVGGWEQLPLTVAAQKVQISGVPDAYAKWESLSINVVNSIKGTYALGDTMTFAGSAGGIDCAAAMGGGASLLPGRAYCLLKTEVRSAADIQVGACPPSGGTEISIPHDPARAAAINWAIGQLGVPYVWGGNGPGRVGGSISGGWDCSSLTQGALRAAGVSGVPRVSQDQQRWAQLTGSSGQLSQGDLVFWYTPATHVGIWLGNGMILHAPTTGDQVKIAPMFDAGVATWGVVPYPSSGTPATTPGQGTQKA